MRNEHSLGNGYPVKWHFKDEVKHIRLTARKLKTKINLILTKYFYLSLQQTKNKQVVSEKSQQIDI